MNPDEIIVHVVNRQRCQVILDLLRECICKAREAAILHSHGEILAFHVRRADVFPVRLANDGLALAANASSGAVPTLVFRASASVNLHQHGVIDVCVQS